MEFKSYFKTALLCPKPPPRVFKFVVRAKRRDFEAVQRRDLTVTHAYVYRRDR